MIFQAILALALFVVVCEAQLRAIPNGRIVAARLADELPDPYSFAFNVADEYGTQWQRSEDADASGVVKGSYGYRDATGLYRVVDYIADDVNGFRASVRSNEPGLANSAPAAVTYTIAN